MWIVGIAGMLLLWFLIAKFETILKDFKQLEADRYEYISLRFPEVVQFGLGRHAVVFLDSSGTWRYEFCSSEIKARDNAIARRGKGNRWADTCEFRGIKPLSAGGGYPHEEMLRQNKTEVSREIEARKRAAIG